MTIFPYLSGLDDPAINRLPTANTFFQPYFEIIALQMKKLLLLLLFLSAGRLATAQNASRSYEDYVQTGDHFEIHVNDGTYRIRFYSPEIVETSFVPAGQHFIDSSYAVTMKPGKTGVSASDTDGRLMLQSTDLSVQIQKHPFQISYFRNGQPLISEKAGYQQDSLETLQFNLGPKEALYGGGARALGMNRRGHRLQLYNKAHYGYGDRSGQLNYSMPVVLSSKEYMILFDNAPAGYLDLDSKGNNTLTYGTIGGRKTYQVIVGKGWLDLIDNYTDLTGKQPLLPQWAMGNFSSRFGYHSQREVLHTIEAFKKDRIPVDAVIMDLYWFSKEVKGNLGNLAFQPDSFPDPRGMINRLHAENVEPILITEPYVQTSSKRWKEAVKNHVLAKDSAGSPYTFDFFFGNTGLIDVFAPQGYRWFKHIYENLLGMGVTGMWGDLGEPETHPDDMIHAAGSALEVHNVYGHEWARLVADAYHSYNPNLRPFILMRAGYAGSQRYGLIPWSGDVSRGWGGLQSQPEISLQMGMQGIGYMHSDLGGFAGANLDDELYVRWLQYGVFQPIYRPHAQEEVPSEPVFRSDSARALAKQAIKLRYRMLPYNYTLVYQNHVHGSPLMRPLFFEEPDNTSLFSYSKAYLWGPDFLVAPILHAGQKEKSVYFPATSDWFDFYTGKKYEGGQTRTVAVPDSTIPTFVRAGAFIPMAHNMQSTKAYSGRNLVLHYYADASVKTSQSELYNDDGSTARAFEQGKYELLHFASRRENGRLELTFTAKTGLNYPAGEKFIDMVVHNLLQNPQRVTVNGEPVAFEWDEETHITRFSLSWNTLRDETVKIELGD